MLWDLNKRSTQSQLSKFVQIADKSLLRINFFQGTVKIRLFYYIQIYMIFMGKFMYDGMEKGRI